MPSTFASAAGSLNPITSFPLVASLKMVNRQGTASEMNGTSLIAYARNCDLHAEISLLLSKHWGSGVSLAT